MRSLLPVLPRPSRYAGIEDGVCRKDPDAVALRVALAFPDTYEVGMSYLGQKILYGIVNTVPRWWAERVMAPDVEAGDLLRGHGAPLCTLESGTPLAKLHAVGFSITHELCYTNVLYMLDLAGIPLRTERRPPSLRECPLIMAGGGALLSAEPLAPFIDLMMLGDGEELLPDVLRLLEEALAGDWTRQAFLEQARHIPGVYVPSFFAPDGDGRLRPLFPDHRPQRRIVADLDDAAYPTAQVVPIGAVHNRLSLEIARGCTRGCRFCQAGMTYRPVRERGLPDIRRLLDDCLSQTGFDEISFLSLSTGDFSALKTLCDGVLDRCAQEQISFSLPSLRVGSIDDGIMRRMADVRRTGCTLAPEAGSQRLRDVINKGVTEEELLLHAQKLLEYGWRQVKLYFMIGLPTETDADLLAIAELCRKVRDAAGRGNPRLQVTASLSPFVPKPFTPFQWEPQISQEEIERRVRLVRDAFKGVKFLKLRWHEPAVSHLEGILSRADRSLADVVERAYRKGAVFSSWMEHFRLEPWLEALEECGIDAGACTRGPALDAPLPWAHLEAGISEDFLRRERERAYAGKITRDCRYGGCTLCGACDTPAGPSLLPHASRRDGETLPHRHRLVFPQRDQQSHQPRRDADGNIICAEYGKTPPQLDPALVFKAVEYRIWHTKLDGGAYLSHLELQAVLERALRRAGVPMSFSRGFHPLPLLSFGRALPVGVQSEVEWFAITLRRHLSPDAVAARLGPMLPQGIGIRAVEKTDKRHRTEQATAEVFRLRLHDAEDTARAVALLRDLMARDTCLIQRENKKGELREVDIRPLFLSLRCDADGAARLTFDWSEAYMSPLVLCLAALRPLDGDGDLPARLRLRKIAQLFDDGSRFPPA